MTKTNVSYMLSSKAPDIFTCVTYLQFNFKYVQIHFSKILLFIDNKKS